MNSFDATYEPDHAGLEPWVWSRFMPRRYRPGNLGNWSGHLPFANDLIAATRPPLLVELGTHYGESYFGFCQSVEENTTGTLCYAVDDWIGEAHSGYYGNEVYEEVKAYNDANYASFSYLLRNTFDDAVKHFSDESISLLHIDGLHTYDAASHDFYTWFPKVRPGGIILLHDTAVRHADFGVWRLWEELKSDHQTFEFLHSWGLGVLRKSGSDVPLDGFLARLFDPARATTEAVRRYYAMYGVYIEHTAAMTRAHVPTVQPPGEVVRLCPYNDSGYADSTSVERDLKFEEPHRFVAHFGSGLGQGPLRIDPCQCSAVIQVLEITIALQDGGETLWSCTEREILERLPLNGTICPFQGQEHASFFSYGADPHLYLHDIPERARLEAVTVTIVLAVTRDLGIIARTVCDQSDRQTAARELERVHNRVQLLTQEIEALRLDLDGTPSIAAERDEMMRELERTRERLQTSAKETETLRRELARTASMAVGRDHIAHELEQVRTVADRLQRDAEQYRAIAAAEQGRRIDLERSLSWRLTAPLRHLGALFIKRS